MGQQGDQQAAIEAAQNVVDEVTSWEYSAEDTTIQNKLDQGFDQAQVEVDVAERQRLVEEIHELRQNEDGGTPQVGAASPKP